MTTLQFSILVNASTSKVWNSLWKKENYTKWTSEFSPGSYYQTDNFMEGNKIHLLTPQGHGLYSILDKIIENEYLAFRHLGEINDFAELPIEENSQAWSNAMETYQLIQIDSKTQLIVHVDTIEDYVDHMNESFPRALAKLKLIAEQ